MKSNLLRFMYVFAGVLALLGVLWGIHRYQVNRFLEEVRQGLKACSEDSSSVDILGYPDGFMSRKITRGEIQTREDVKRLMHGHSRFESRMEDGEIVDIYTFRIGLIPFDDRVVFIFQQDGTFNGMPIDGPSWK